MIFHGSLGSKTELRNVYAWKRWVEILINVAFVGSGKLNEGYLTD